MKYLIWKRLMLVMLIFSVAFAGRILTDAASADSAQLAQESVFVDTKTYSQGNLIKDDNTSEEATEDIANIEDEEVPLYAGESSTIAYFFYVIIILVGTGAIFGVLYCFNKLKNE